MPVGGVGVDLGAEVADSIVAAHMGVLMVAHGADRLEVAVVAGIRVARMDAQFFFHG